LEIYSETDAKQKPQPSEGYSSAISSSHPPEQQQQHEQFEICKHYEYSKR